MQTLGHCGGIDEISQTDLAGDVVVESFQLDFAFHGGADLSDLSV